MSDISRDPGAYSPSTHAVQQRKHRGIDWELVAKTIEDGDIKDSHETNVCIFVKDFGVFEKPVGVVANYEIGVILTIEWRE